MTPTTQQLAFITALTSTTSHLALVARAGTGKTSTIVLGVDAYALANPTHEICVVAYNKAIADEVGGKLKAAGHADWRKVSASTVHALGWGLVRFAFRLDKNDIDDKKVRKLVDAMAAAGDYAAQTYGAQVTQLVRYAKQAGFGFFQQIGSVDAWQELADHFDVNGLDDTSEAELVVAAAQLVYRQSLADTTCVDFDDMILFPLVKNLRVKYTKDLMIVDEAQDLSPARQALIRKFLGASGRLVIVGDDRQAIYGFSGADAQSLANLTAQFGMTVLPLTTTWRCPQAVVRLAQTLVPDLQASPTALEGAVLKLDAMPDDLKVGDAILCRNTAPLIQQAYRLIRAGIPAKVEGRQIGEGLKALARRWKVRTISALLNRLEEYKDREIQKAMAKGNEAKVEEVTDRVGTLVEICQACLLRNKKTVADVITFVDDLFADGAENAVILATYHRSKGREWDRVLLLEHAARCPSRAARQDWQKAQETNLAYVAFTRAKHTLAFVG